MNRTYAPGVALAALLLTVTACGGDATETDVITAPEADRMTGTIALRGNSTFDGNWTNCAGNDGYDDFSAGMNVTVRDGDGTIVGTGNARNLKRADQSATEPVLASTATQAQQMYRTVCTLWFDLDVPHDAAFYSVEAGHRGELTYSADELEATDWHVELSLG